jgi:hypothetical protein
LPISTSLQSLPGTPMSRAWSVCCPLCCEPLSSCLVAQAAPSCWSIEAHLTHTHLTHGMLLMAPCSRHNSCIHENTNACPVTHLRRQYCRLCRLCRRIKTRMSSILLPRQWLSVSTERCLCAICGVWSCLGTRGAALKRMLSQIELTGCAEWLPSYMI